MNWNEISKFKIALYVSIVCPKIIRMLSDTMLREETK